MYQCLKHNLMEFFADARCFWEILLNVKLLRKPVQSFQQRQKTLRTCAVFGFFFWKHWTEFSTCMSDISKKRLKVNCNNKLYFLWVKISVVLTWNFKRLKLFSLSFWVATLIDLLSSTLYGEELQCVYVCIICVSSKN